MKRSALSFLFFLTVALSSNAIAQVKSSDEKERQCDKTIQNYRAGFVVGYDQTKQEAHKQKIDELDAIRKNKSPCAALEDIKPLVVKETH